MTHLATAASHRPLRARTEGIDAPTDLLAHLGRDGFAWCDDDVAFVTSGVAARVRATDVAATLERIEHHTGSSDGAASAPVGPIAVGALPFADADRGGLFVPAVVVGTDRAGRAWRTEITGPGVSSVEPALHPAATRPTRFTFRAQPPVAEWERQVRAAVERIRAGALAKVVLARHLELDADLPFAVRAIVEVLRRTQPGSTVYAHGGFVGASPELLVRRRGHAVESRPMAGTVARGASRPDDDRAAAALLESTKDADEHRLVVDAVTGVLDGWCDDVRADGPIAARFASVTHLATHVTGRLRDATKATALDLALALHPTPAVAGTPTPAALALLHELEGRDRDRYAGPVGWVHANGDGEFAVALRCAHLDGTHARLTAGAGIVADSDPAAEWAETQAKLEPMLQALVRG
ncbi:MAG TPA: isochorismate synthase [Acidimicrobiia bacterium]|nr:isochorismate synthase [Acidimicrobiia bacterium]